MKKKIFAIAAALSVAATTLTTTVYASGTESAAEDGGGFSWNWIIMIAIYGAVIAGAYFLLFRPQSKKKKKEAALRRNAQIGDEITTIGGITGRIVAIKEESDTLILETGSDRHRINIKRWAISSVDTPQTGADASKTEEPKRFSLFGGSKNNDEKK